MFPTRHRATKIKGYKVNFFRKMEYLEYNRWKNIFFFNFVAVYIAPIDYVYNQ